MKITNRLKMNWILLDGKQKLIVGVVLGLILIFAVSGWVGSVKTYFEVRALEKQVKQSKAEADAALKRAAEIAGEIKKREAEIKVLEEKRDVKKTELGQAEKQSSDSLDAVDRARREPRADDVSAEQLCTELAELGYPCR